jgi:hypothetical protein
MLASIRDSFFGTIEPTVPFTSPPGDGNLNAVVTIACGQRSAGSPAGVGLPGSPLTA